jgi:hypothetical protein
VSAGFDAHKNDPLNLGGLSAEDFGTLTEIICKLAFKSCSGRVLSVLEGGYGVPCCRPQQFPSKTEEPITTGKEGEQAHEVNSPSCVLLPVVLPEGEQTTVPAELDKVGANAGPNSTVPAAKQEQMVPLQCLDLGEELPPDMPDVVSSYVLQKRLDRCHAEGFIQCVREHVKALVRCNNI